MVINSIDTQKSGCLHGYKVRDNSFLFYSLVHSLDTRLKLFHINTATNYKRCLAKYNYNNPAHSNQYPIYDK
jgi:hypothetical protein